MKRIPQLDGLRALAIAAVFLHHAYKAKLLWMGVDLFFILSGFLITGILANEKSRPLSEYFSRFYAKRVRRILPPYLLLLIFVSIFFNRLWMHQWYLYIGAMNFVAFHPVHTGTKELGALWSLAVEEQFYFVWPFAVYFLSRRHLMNLSIALIIAAPLLRYFCTPLFASHWVIYNLTPFRMDLLAVGALLSMVWKTHSEKIREYGWLGIFAPVLSLPVFFLLSRHGYTTYSDQPLGNVLVYESSLFACLGIMIWALSGRYVRILTLPPVIYIGRISYSLYLIHLSMLSLFPVWAAVLMSILYATVSWYVVERPILGLNRPHAAQLKPAQTKAA